jgi:hypothetical protein
MAQWVRISNTKSTEERKFGSKNGQSFTMDMHVLAHTHIHQQLCKEQFSKGMSQWFIHYTGTLLYMNIVNIHCLSACLSLRMQ